MANSYEEIQAHLEIEKEQVAQNSLIDFFVTLLNAGQSGEAIVELGYTQYLVDEAIKRLAQRPPDTSDPGSSLPSEASTPIKSARNTLSTQSPPRDPASPSTGSPSSGSSFCSSPAGSPVSSPASTCSFLVPRDNSVSKPLSDWQLPDSNDKDACASFTPLFDRTLSNVLCTRMHKLFIFLTEKCTEMQKKLPDAKTKPEIRALLNLYVDEELLASSADYIALKHIEAMAPYFKFIIKDNPDNQIPDFFQPKDKKLNKEDLHKRIAEITYDFISMDAERHASPFVENHSNEYLEILRDIVAPRLSPRMR